jgi:hypothetical protein
VGNSENSGIPKRKEKKEKERKKNERWFFHR